MNIGILAHVDAGKTSLTERLLFFAGVIDRLGSVDAGSTQTDSLEIEKERGITVQSSVVSFRIGDRKINLIDTPGHSDFIAEVERSLSVLDAVVLVISAVEGVQSQTRILMRTLTRLKIPTLLFVNKIDRKGARYEDLLKEISQKLTPNALAMQSVEDLGMQTASVRSFLWDEPIYFTRAIDLFSSHSDSFLQSYVEGSLVKEDFHSAWRDQVAKAELHPTYFGSAITGEGIAELVCGICTLPSKPTSGELKGVIFKIEWGKGDEKIAYIRIHSGTLKLRESFEIYRRNKQLSGKVTRIEIFEEGGLISVLKAGPGEIVKVWGLKEVCVGDQLGRGEPQALEGFFSPPALETVIQAIKPDEETKLFAALRKMTQQDPLMNARVDKARQEISVCLYGAVQKEVIKTRLQREFGIAVQFKETKVIFIERPKGEGEYVHEIDFHGENAFFATIGLKISPGPSGSGIVYRLGVEKGALPRAYHSVVQDAIYRHLQEGLHGWEVTDCVVTLTRAGLCPLSMAVEFRKLTPIVLRKALEAAGTVICAPYHHFDMEIPQSAIAGVLSKIFDVEATLLRTIVMPDGVLLEGKITAERLPELERALPHLTQGNGILCTRFAGFEEVY